MKTFIFIILVWIWIFWIGQMGTAQLFLLQSNSLHCKRVIAQGDCYTSLSCSRCCCKWRSKISAFSVQIANANSCGDLTGTYKALHSLTQTIKNQRKVASNQWYCNKAVFKLKKKWICSLYLRCDRCSHVVRIEGSVKREDHSQYFSKQAQAQVNRTILFVVCGMLHLCVRPWTIWMMSPCWIRSIGS